MRIWRKRTEEEARAASDGREALERAERESYDLVICDMKMPGLDGQHFYRSLARNGNSLRERFLFVTGDVMAAHTREFLKRNNLPHGGNRSVSRN